jgi:hypothetical protein
LTAHTLFPYILKYLNLKLWALLEAKSLEKKGTTALGKKQHTLNRPGEFNPSHFSKTIVILLELISYSLRRLRLGQSPAVLAGVDLHGLPWFQFILIQLAKARWLKSDAPDFHILLGL